MEYFVYNVYWCTKCERAVVDKEPPEPCHGEWENIGWEEVNEKRHIER